MSDPLDPYRSPQWPHERPVVVNYDLRLRHSGVGIASFVISLVAGLLLVIMIGVCSYLVASRHGEVNEESPEAVAVGLTMLGSLFAELVALVLGIIGLAQRDRKKIFAILGTVFSGLALLGLGGLLLLGAMMS